MPRFVLSAAAALVAIVTATTQPAAAGKVPGLHVHSALPPSYGHARVPRVVRNFNHKQQVRAPKKSIGLSPRR